MKQKTSLPVCVLLLLSAAVCGCTGAADAGDACSDVAAQKEMLILLNTMQGGIGGALALLDARVETTAQNLTATGLAGADAEALLTDALAADPSVTTAITIGRNGTCLAAVPESVASLVGEDLGGREVVRETFERKVPVMTGVVPLHEGGQAAIIEYPVFGEDECLVGATSITFDPCLLLREEIEPVLSGTPYTAMVAEAGGRVLYDPDPAEVGKETFNESLYAEFPEVLAFARAYSDTWSGHATYSFSDTGFSRTVQKEAYWTTVGLHGTEWRLIIIREIGEA